MTEFYKQQPCERFAPLISAMIDGELESDSTIVLNEHLDACESCRQRVESFRQIDSMVFQSSDPSQTRVGGSTAPAASLKTPKSSSAQPGSRSFTKSLMRWIPLATAATILVALMITSLPSNRSTVTAEQIARPLAELEIINADHRESQERMRKMLELDLRALRLEIGQLNGSEPDDAAHKQRLENHLNRLIERVSRFGQ